MSGIEVVDYDESWPAKFAQLRDVLAPAVSGLALSIEHVGSTSVPGLAAKPVIDIDIVVRANDIPAAVQRVVDLGYQSIGDLGIPQREAFRAPAGSLRHNLYVTAEGSESLRNHLCLREYLLAHPEAAMQYGALKKRLAAYVEGDMDRYVAGKSDFIANVLAQTGFSPSEVEAIRTKNALPSPKQLLGMKAAQLDALFARCASGPVPDGRSAGVALIATGTPLAAFIARATALLAWKGKTVDAARGRLVNRITPFGIPAVGARVYLGASLYDGRPCVVLDYSRTSLVARWIRDELRMLEPGYYLGKVYFAKLPTFRFCLRF